MGLQAFKEMGTDLRGKGFWLRYTRIYFRMLLKGRRQRGRSSFGLLVLFLAMRLPAYIPVRFRASVKNSEQQRQCYFDILTPLNKGAGGRVTLKEIR